MKNIITAICTGFGLGFFPIAPGTVGTLLGIPLAWLWGDKLWLVFALALMGIWAAQQGEKYFGCKDSPHIIIDEIAGYMVAMFALPHVMIVPAFVLFRFFDIVKPGPINRIQALPGGWGVMADDLLAGLVTNLILQMVDYLLI